MMIPQITHERPAIRQDEHGRYRVGQTRVLLDLVVYAFKRGDKPENIIESYLSLTLADAYAAIAYYLHHANIVDEYLRLQEAQAEAFRQQYEAEHPNRLTREQLQERLKNRQTNP